MLKITMRDKVYQARGISGAIATILFVPALVVTIFAVVVIVLLALPSFCIGMIGAEEVPQND